MKCDACATLRARCKRAGCKSEPGAEMEVRGELQMEMKGMIGMEERERRKGTSDERL